MKTYRSRVSIILVIFLYSVCIAQGAISYLAGGFLMAITLTLLGLITAIVWTLCFGIKYVINGDKLEVRSLGQPHVIIDIHSITHFEENHDLASAPASSLSRLWVCYGNGERVNISPRNQDEFIAEINAIRNAK